VKPYYILPHEVESVWHAVESLISEACEYNNGRYAAEDYKEMLLSGDMQLWLAIDGGIINGLAITMLVPFPRKKCCVIDICTGSGLEGWVHFTALIEEWAVSNGCHQMFNHARPGMERLLKSQGYRKTHVILEKDLNGSP
jgi:hypothetical protein